MNDEALSADDGFFRALLANDGGKLEKLLDDGFVLVDVMSGGVMDKPSFLAALRSDLRFLSIEPSDRKVRIYGDAAIVVGRTKMNGTYVSAPFEFRSRYTHVFVRAKGIWRIVSAQGTPIVS